MEEELICKCTCCKLRGDNHDFILARKRTKTYAYCILDLTLFAYIICATVYFVCIVQNLSANNVYALESIENLKTDMYSLKQKHNRLERQLKAITSMNHAASAGWVSNSKLDSYAEESENHAEELESHAEKLESNAEALMTESNKIETDLKSSINKQYSVGNLLTREKRSKRKKKCKNCLPAIQIEGVGGPQMSANKFDISGVWTPASWHKLYRMAKSAFQYSRVGQSGLVLVKKTGLYLLYAQVTLVGVHKRGYKIILKKADGNESTLAVCKRHYKHEGISESDSCCAVKLVALGRGDGIFVREEGENTGANFSKSHSYFGLVRLGNLS